VENLEAAGIWGDINAGKVKGFKSIWVSQDKDSNADLVVLHLKKEVYSATFIKVMEFWYTGLVTLKDKHDGVEPVIEAGKLFDCEELVTIGNNVMEGNEVFNPSIGTWLNDKLGEKAMELFFNKSLFSDITLSLKGSGVKFSGHRALMASQCPYFATMLSSGFVESSSKEVVVGGEVGTEDEVSQTAFMAVLEYIYSSHAPIEHSDDMVGILTLANRWGLSRLVTLCELYISKAVEVATKDDIAKADIDVIGLLLSAQECNAKQLSDFCLHFISSNYQPMKKRPEWELLIEENIKYVEEHQWPPVSYLKELEKYEKLTGKKRDGDEKCITM